VAGSRSHQFSGASVTGTAGIGGAVGGVSGGAGVVAGGAEAGAVTVVVAAGAQAPSATATRKTHDGIRFTLQRSLWRPDRIWSSAGIVSDRSGPLAIDRILATGLPAGRGPPGSARANGRGGRRRGWPSRMRY